MNWKQIKVTHNLQKKKKCYNTNFILLHKTAIGKSIYYKHLKSFLLIKMQMNITLNIHLMHLLQGLTQPKRTSPLRFSSQILHFTVLTHPWNNLWMAPSNTKKTLIALMQQQLLTQCCYMNNRYQGKAWRYLKVELDQHLLFKNSKIQWKILQFNG